MHQERSERHVRADRASPLDEEHQRGQAPPGPASCLGRAWARRPTGASFPRMAPLSHSPASETAAWPQSSSAYVMMRSVTARQRYDEMLRDEVGPWLRERGFRKRRNRFRCVDDQGWQVVDFQASQWGSRDDVRFTINLWIGVTELQAVESDAQVQQRVGALLPGGEDHWWSVDDATNTSALATELREVLGTRCLPWLDARRSLDQLMRLARD